MTDLEAVNFGTLKEYLDFANAYAAYTTTREGALAAMADAREFADFRKNLQ